MELSIAAVYFLQLPLPHYEQLSGGATHISTTSAQKTALLERHKTRLYSDSQFWH